MTVTYHSGRRLQGLDADRTATQLPAGAVGGWVELGRTTLGSAGDPINVSGLADKRYLMVLFDARQSGYITTDFRFNSDSGTNYSTRYSANGGADVTATSQNYLAIVSNGNNWDKFNVSYIANKSDKEKLLISHNIFTATGAGNAPERSENVGKWANTSNAISAIQGYNRGVGDYASGSEVVVLGYDPADTHTTNFWQELASVEASGTVTSLDTGTFTAKKYLWIQCFMKLSGSPSLLPTFNNDSGSNYSFRYSDNGGADSTATSQTNIGTLNQGYSNTFTNIFVINNQSNEKLCLVNGMNQNTAGAGNAPARRELVAKWANTSNQITSFKVSGSSIASGSKIKVWGAD